MLTKTAENLRASRRKAHDFFTVFFWCWDGRYNKSLKEWPHGETVSLVSPRPKCSSRLPPGEHRGSRRRKAHDFFTVFFWCWDGRYNKSLKEWPHGETVSLVSPRPKCSSRLPPGEHRGSRRRKAHDFFTVFFWCWDGRYNKSLKEWPHGETVSLVSPRPKCSSRLPPGEHRGSRRRKAHDFFTVFFWCWDGRYNKSLKEWPHGETVSLVSPRPKCSSRLPPGEHRGSRRGKANDFFTVFIWCWDGRYNKTLKEWPHGETVSLVSPRPKCSSRLPLGEHRGSRRGKANDFLTVFFWFEMGGI